MTPPDNCARRLTEAESLLLEATEYLPAGDHLKARIEAYLTDAVSLGDDLEPPAVLMVPGVAPCPTLNAVRRAMREAAIFAVDMDTPATPDWLTVDLKV